MYNGGSQSHEPRAGRCAAQALSPFPCDLSLPSKVTTTSEREYCSSRSLVAYLSFDKATTIPIPVPILLYQHTHQLTFGYFIHLSIIMHNNIQGGGGRRQMLSSVDFYRHVPKDLTEVRLEGERTARTFG